MRPCQCQLHNRFAANHATLVKRRACLRSAAFSKHRGHSSKQSQRLAPCPCRASAEGDSNNANDSKVVKKSDGRISTTLAGLDALLGVQEEKKDTEEHNKKEASHACRRICSIGEMFDSIDAHADVRSMLQEAEKSERVTLDVSPDVVKSIAQADLGRKGTQNGASKESKDAEKQLSDQMVCLLACPA